MPDRNLDTVISYLCAAPGLLDEDLAPVQQDYRNRLIGYVDDISGLGSVVITEKIGKALVVQVKESVIKEDSLAVVREKIESLLNRQIEGKMRSDRIEREDSKGGGGLHGLTLRC